MYTITQEFDSLVARPIGDADEFLDVRMELKWQLFMAREVRDRNFWDIGMDCEVENLEQAFEQFDIKHATFAEMMRGALKPQTVLDEARRCLSASATRQLSMSISPYSAVEYVSDWNEFVSMFDKDVQYTDVTPAVRDVLLALTHAPSVPYGLTLCMHFSLSDGSFTTRLGDGEKVDVFAGGRCWASFVDVPRAKRMKKSARGAGRVLWTLLHHHRARYEDGGELVLDTDRGDALRRAYNPVISEPVRRNLEVRTRRRGGVYVRYARVN